MVRTDAGSRSKNRFSTAKVRDTMFWYHQRFQAQTFNNLHYWLESTEYQYDYFPQPVHFDKVNTLDSNITI